jgi:translocation and assembly module TamB
MSKQRRILKRLGYVLVGVLAAPFVLMGAVLVVLDADWARETAVAEIESATAAGPVRVDIGSIAPGLPSRIELNNLVLSDRSGVFARVGHLSVAWSPLSALSGVVTVERVAIEDASFDRLPVLPETAETEPATASEPLTLEFPAPPIGLDLKSFTVSTLSLGADIAGQEAVITADLNAAVDGSRAALAGMIGIARPDNGAAPGTITLDLAVDPTTGTLQAKINASEPAGGLVASLAGVPGVPALDLQVDGTGTLADWSGRLAGGFGAGAQADLNLGVKQSGADIDLSVEGTAEPGVFLPPNIAPLVGPSVPLSTAVLLAGDGSIRLTKLSVQPAIGKIDATALVSADGVPVQADVAIRLPDLAQLSSLAGADLAGDVGLVLKLDDQGRHATATLSGTPRVDGQTAEGLSVVLQVRAAAPLADLPETLTVSLDGGADVPRLPDLDLAELLGPRLTVSGRADVNPDTLNAEITNLSLATDGVGVSVTGRLVSGNQLDGRVSVTAFDLARFQDLAGVDLAGVADLEADVAATLEPLSVQVAADLTGLGIATGLYEVDAILGSQPTLTSGITLSGDQLSVIGLELKAALLSLAGNVDLDLAVGDLAGRIDAMAPNLAPVGDAVGTGLTGDAALAVALGGTMDAPAVSASWRIGDLTVDGTPVGGVTGTATASGLPASPQGAITVDVATAQGALALVTDYRLEGEALSVSGLSLSGLGVEATGDVNAILSGPTVDGRITLKSENLATLGRAFDAPLRAGSIDATVTLSPDNGQSAVLDGTLSGLKIAGDAPVTINRIGLAAGLRDLLTAPAGTANIRITSLATGDVAIEQITLAAESDGARATADLNVAGQIGSDRAAKSLRLSMTSEARLDADPIAITVSKLEATQGGATASDEAVVLTARLRDPLSITLGNAVAFDNLALLLSAGGGSGVLSGKGSLNPEKLDVVLALRGLPSDLARAADPSLDLRGTLDGDVSVRGPIENPVVDVSLNTKGITSADPEFADVPPLIVDFVAGLRDRVLKTRFSASIGEGATVNALAELALASGGAGAPPAFDPAGRVDGSINALADLERMNAFLPLDDGVIDGDVRVDVAIGQTLANPQVSGTARLDGGAVEHSGFGIAYRDIVLLAEGEADRLVLRRLTASSVAGGSIEGSGYISLDVDNQAPADIRLEARDFTAVEMDTATVRVSTDLSLTGRLPTYLLAGQITIGPSEIRIPDALPSSVTTIEVTEIGENGQILNPPSEEELAARNNPEEANAPLELDLVIDVPNQVFVRGRGLDSEWGGRLAVKGLADAPEVTGQIAVQRGTLDALGQNFTFNKGRVVFDGAPPDNPTLDMDISAKVADILATVLVTGSAQDPSIQLTSDPTLTREEILSRLLFGQAKAELTPLQALKLAQSAAVLSGGFGSGPGITDQLRDALGVDTIDVNTGDVGEGGRGASLSVGKYIADGVFLRLEQGLSAADSRAVVEVEITDHITVETDVGADAASRAGINWKLDY